MRGYFYLLMLIFLVSSCSTQSYLTQNSYVKTVNKTALDQVKTSLVKPDLQLILLQNDLEGQESRLNDIETDWFLSQYTSSVQNIIVEAKSFIGTPYRYGGESRRGIDCSAFMQRIYQKEGIHLPRVSAQQAKTGIPVSRGELQKGDLIFFSTTSPYRITHVGMVLEVSDDVYFIHSSSSQGVGISGLSHPYWNAKYRSARRPQRFIEPKLAHKLNSIPKAILATN